MLVIIYHGNFNYHVVIGCYWYYLVERNHIFPNGHNRSTTRPNMQDSDIGP
jgi:hypothetical protein